MPVHDANSQTFAETPPHRSQPPRRGRAFVPFLTASGPVLTASRLSTARRLSGGAWAATALLVAASFCATGTASAQARDYINIVGSSTVYPFATVVAERFGRGTPFKTPKVESTGSGGGLKLFCNGVGVQYPDIANSSRRIKESEVDMCASNGVDAIIELIIGYDGIVLANAKDAPTLDLSLRDVYLALAKSVPDPSGAQRFVENPYITWDDVNPALPDTRIEVLGPPPTSGTRDAFLELVMEGGCSMFEWVAELDEVDFLVACHTIREDGAYVEAGENDNLIVQKLEANPDAVGLFGYSFLEQNSDRVKGLPVQGVAPNFDSISDGSYVVSRPLYIYVKRVHVGAIPGMQEYLREFTSEGAAGDFGYLSDKGLIPLAEAERREMVTRVQSLETLQLADLL